MDETEFLRSIEGEQQNGEDLVAGAEHFIRLKKQVGMSRPSDESLELEKEAGALATGTAAVGGVYALGKHLNKEAKDSSTLPVITNSLLNAGAGATCCGKDKTACLCKTAKLRNFISQNPRSVASAGGALIGGAAGSMDKENPKRTAMLGAVGGGTIGALGGHLGTRTGGLLRASRSVKDEVANIIAKSRAGSTKHASDLREVLFNARIKTAAANIETRPLQYHLSHKLEEMREKTAGSLVGRLKDVNPGVMVTTGLGALAAGVGTYLGSRPQKDTGKSKAEEELEGRVLAQKSKPARGLLSKMHNNTTELAHSHAKAFREHPRSAAALGTISGGIGGYGLGRLLGGK